MSFVRLAFVLLSVGLAGAPTVARAAQSYDSCAGFIDSLPAVITKQGTWCLRKDLSTPMATGAAITVAANNVTIDCNHFKVGGLSAGDASRTVGIYSDQKENVTVRHCNLRGFYAGVYLWRGAGHLIEDNRVDNALGYGLFMLTDWSSSGMVRNNLVIATGGAPEHTTVLGIAANADIIDNTVDGVFTATANGSPVGINPYGDGNEVRGNRVRGLVPTGTGVARGVHVMASSVIVSGNRFTSSSPINAVAVEGGPYAICQDNLASRYATFMNSCADAGGNYANGVIQP